MRGVYLYGASGHGLVIKDIIEACGDYVIAFIDDNITITEHCHLPVIHDINSCTPILISIGSNYIRRNIVERVKAEFVTYIHPSAVVSPYATIGEGTIIMPGAIVNAYAKIGKHCIINTGSTVDHECVIHDYCHIAPGVNICGCTVIGEATCIGVGSSVIQCLKIGKNSIIGAGSVVVNDIPDDVIAYGNPCKIIKSNIYY